MKWTRGFARRLWTTWLDFLRKMVYTRTSTIATEEQKTDEQVSQKGKRMKTNQEIASEIQSITLQLAGLINDLWAADGTARYTPDQKQGVFLDVQPNGGPSNSKLLDFELSDFTGLPKGAELTNLIITKHWWQAITIPGSQGRLKAFAGKDYRHRARRFGFPIVDAIISYKGSAPKRIVWMNDLQAQACRGSFKQDAARTAAAQL